MRIIRIPLDAVAEGELELPEAAAIYATRVLRMKPGARFVAFDPARAVEADGELLEVGKRVVTARFQALRGAPRAAREVTIVQAIGKGDKLDAIVRDATELGATRVIPAVAERSVRRPNVSKSSHSKRDGRLSRVAIEAARQCGRGDAPRIDEPMSLADALESAAPHADGGLCALLHPDGDEPLGAALQRVDAASPVVFVIGPEGGFSSDELAAARELGYAIVRLGAFVLRTETSCAAALGALLGATHG